MNNNNNNQMPTNAMNMNQYVNANKQLLSRTGDQNISNNISNVHSSKINPKKYDTKRKRNEIDNAQEEILMNDQRKSIDNGIMPKVPDSV